MAGIALMLGACVFGAVAFVFIDRRFKHNATYRTTVRWPLVALGVFTGGSLYIQRYGVAKMAVLLIAAIALRLWLRPSEPPQS